MELTSPSKGHWGHGNVDSADRLIRCNGVFSSLPTSARTDYPLAAGANSVLSVDGQDGHSDRLSSRSRKWELEGSCYQAPSFLLVLHEGKPKPCVLLTPCGPARLVCKCCGCLNNPSYRTIVTWIPQVCQSMAVSGRIGGRLARKLFLSAPGLYPTTDPCPFLVLSFKLHHMIEVIWEIQ